MEKNNEEVVLLRAQVQDQDVQIKQLRAELNSAREDLRKKKAIIGQIYDIVAERASWW